MEARLDAAASDSGFGARASVAGTQGARVSHELTALSLPGRRARVGACLVHVCCAVQLYAHCRGDCERSPRNSHAYNVHMSEGALQVVIRKFTKKRAAVKHG